MEYPFTCTKMRKPPYFKQNLGRGEGLERHLESEVLWALPWGFQGLVSWLTLFSSDLCLEMLLRGLVLSFLNEAPGCTKACFPDHPLMLPLERGSLGGLFCPRPTHVRPPG